MSILALAACSPAPDEGAPPVPGAEVGSVPVRAAPPSFSREAFAPPRDAGASFHEGDSAPKAAAAGGEVADPAALDEILSAAARGSEAGQATQVDRSALLGTDTGVPADAGPAEARSRVPSRSPDFQASPVAKIGVGKVTVEPGMSSAGIERALRAQIYWPLVRRCRDRRGAILPPEVIQLRFHLDLDGYVIPATVLAVPKEQQYEDAARCMGRELSMATFRGPAAARGQPQEVITDVPSVD